MKKIIITAFTFAALVSLSCLAESKIPCIKGSCPDPARPGHFIGLCQDGQCLAHCQECTYEDPEASMIQRIMGTNKKKGLVRIFSMNNQVNWISCVPEDSMKQECDMLKAKYNERMKNGNK